MAASATAKRQQSAAQLANLRPFQPGQSGNPAGRKKGSRNKLSESFIQALSDDFDQHGVAVIENVRIEKPADYLKIIAAIVPKELNVRDASLEDMSDEELLDSLEQVRSLAAALVGGKASSRVAKARGKKEPRSVN